MIEIVMIQLFSLLLGNPVYTFAIVLAALLLFRDGVRGSLENIL